MVTRFNEAVKCDNGLEVSGTTTLPACISSNQISAVLNANKLRHEIQYTYTQSGTVGAATAYGGIVSTAGTVRTINATLVSACTTTDTVTVQVAYYNGTTWVNLMSGDISFSSSDAALSVKSGTLTTPGATAITANALLRFTVAGTNTSGANLSVTLIVDEAANS